MEGVGIAWAGMVSMPYAVPPGSLPPENTGLPGVVIWSGTSTWWMENEQREASIEKEGYVPITRPDRQDPPEAMCHISNLRK